MTASTPTVTAVAPQKEALAFDGFENFQNLSLAELQDFSSKKITEKQVAKVIETALRSVGDKNYWRSANPDVSPLA